MDRSYGSVCATAVICFQAGINGISRTTGAGTPTVRRNVLTASARRPRADHVADDLGQARVVGRAGAVDDERRLVDREPADRRALPRRLQGQRGTRGRPEHVGRAACGVDDGDEVLHLPGERVRRGAGAAVPAAPSVVGVDGEVRRAAARRVRARDPSPAGTSLRPPGPGPAPNRGPRRRSPCRPRTSYGGWWRSACWSWLSSGRRWLAIRRTAAGVFDMAAPNSSAAWGTDGPALPQRWSEPTLS